MPRLERNVAITGGVILLHVAALWALNTGLLRRAVEIVVPIEMLSEILAPPAPKVEPPAPQPQPPLPPQPVRQPVVRKVQPTPQPVAIPDPRPAPDAPTGVIAPQPPAPPIAAAAAAPSPAPAPASTKVELPSSDADYLQNPKPAYPPLSKRLGEQGKVVLRVLIGADGVPQKTELLKSSGFDRLDQAAQATVMKWRFVPGKRGGVPETAWAQVPINFVLE